MPDPTTADPGLRDRIAQALADADGWVWAAGCKEHSSMWQSYQHRADKVLAVHPAPADRSAVLLRRTESYLSALHGSVARHDNLGVNLGCAGCELRGDLRAELRRMADEAQQTERRQACVCGQPSEHCDTVDGEAADRILAERLATSEAQQPEAHSSQNAWRVELYDPAAEEWVPSSSLADLATARARLAHARERSPKWKDDDTHVQRRIVRETTTYTVEAEHTPQQAGEAR